MIFLLLLLFTFCAQSTVVHRVVSNYNRAHSGWITLELDQRVLNKQLANVLQVDWCESLEPNPPKESKLVIRELRSCSSPGLMRERLYPSGTLVNLETPNVVHIDPQNVGGWDDEHQAQIVVKAAFNGGREILEHVFRFNPLYERIPEEHQIPQTSNSEEHQVPSTGNSEEHQVSQPSNSEEHQVSQTSNSEEHQIPSNGNLEKPPVPSNENSEEPQVPLSWSGPITILGVGLMLLLGAALLGQRRKRQALFDEPAAEKGWVDIMMSVKEEDDDREANMRILMNMGHGANPVFLQNL